MKLSQRELTRLQNSLQWLVRKQGKSKLLFQKRKAIGIKLGFIHVTWLWRMQITDKFWKFYPLWLCLHEYGKGSPSLRPCCCASPESSSDCAHSNINCCCDGEELLVAVGGKLRGGGGIHHINCTRRSSSKLKTHLQQLQLRMHSAVWVMETHPVCRIWITC